MNHTADLDDLEDVREPRSAWATVTAIVVAAIALIALFIAVLAIRAQSFLPEFASTITVVPTTEPGLEAPGMVAAAYDSVELRVRAEVASARWWHALSLTMAYSVVIVGLGVIALALWKLRTRRSFAPAATWGLGGFGVWVIVAVTLQKLFENQSVHVLVRDLQLPTAPPSPDESATATWVLLPSFIISQSMLLMMSVGLVLILAAALLGRAWRMQTELDEVI